VAGYGHLAITMSCCIPVVLRFSIVCSFLLINTTEVFIFSFFEHSMTGVSFMTSIVHETTYD